MLADVPPCAEELIYGNHARGFALASMRSPSRSRYYVQCGLDDQVEDWTDARFRDELCLRLGRDVSAGVTRGASFEKSIAPLRSFVTEPMRFGLLLLANDAAHVVPPTGAKGTNLAVSDIIMLHEALTEFFGAGSEAALDRLQTRRIILGDAHVDRSIAATTPLTDEFQHLITRLAWGEIWPRPGIAPETRRLLTLAMMIALNREGELNLHLRATLDHKVSPDIIKEILLQSAVYCYITAADAPCDCLKR